jgi:primosomal protein N'
VLSRYEGGDLQYLKGQSFKLVMNYLDEIEALKEEAGKVKESGMREKEEAVTKWKRLVMKAQVKHKAEIEKETIVISGLKEEIEDLKLTVKGLTCMLGEPELKRGQSLQKAYERHREEVQKSAERFKMVLMQAVTGMKITQRYC